MRVCIECDTDLTGKMGVDVFVSVAGELRSVPNALRCVKCDNEIQHFRRKTRLTPEKVDELLKTGA